MSKLNNMLKNNKGGLLCTIHDNYKGSPEDSVSISTMTHACPLGERQMGSRLGLRSVVI